jgi:hypothetical protein
MPPDRGSRASRAGLSGDKLGLMSNTALAWLAILLLVVPFGIVTFAERVSNGPDWLDSEGFEMFMSLIAFVALMGLFPLVAANGRVVENGSIHLSESVPVLIVSVVALIIAIGISVALIGAAVAYFFILLFLLPYELVVRRARRAWRITKLAGRDYDADGYRITHPRDYGVPYYGTRTGKHAYLIHDGWFRKVCAVVDDERVAYYSRAGDQIGPPLLWGYSHQKFYGPSVVSSAPIYARLFTQYLPRRLDIGPAEAAHAVTRPPGS